jgi:murein DD-endopeptidase MepM/ murein hydrolase activator NlpD
MKNLSKIILLLSLSSCEFSQPPAVVEYHLEDYYGYGDVQGAPAPGSKGDVALQNKGVPVVIEDISQTTDYTIAQTATGDNATQVYTVSDKVGPQIIRNSRSSSTEEVNISSKTHIVQKGETLFSISRKYDIPILPIIVANSLEQPYAVNEGQIIKLPEGKFHTVKEGETLYSISRQYGVDMSGIVKLNELPSPYNVVKSQRLQIPFPTDVPTEDSFSGDSEALVETTISNEQPTYSAPTQNDGKPASLRRPSGGVLGSYNDQQPTISPQPIDTEIETAKLVKPEKVTDAPVKQDGKFMWPVQGKVVKNFGQQGGEYNDGINISVSAGTAVKASNSGRVVYTGNSLKSYGNLVIIKHDSGLLSAYAHMNSVNVKKDQQISKGQAIGTVGSTGKVTSPQLYFAIRKGKDAKNPMNYLR